MTTADENEPKGTSLAWLVYGQIAAMLGAFSLLVFGSHFLELGLKGVVQEAFAVWAEYVRPFVGYPFQYLADQLPTSWRFRVPDLVKDYVSVGLTFGLSFLRVLGADDARADLRVAVANLAINTLLWPFVIVEVVRALITRDKEFREIGIPVLAWFAPLLYLGLLLALNAWLAGYCPTASSGTLNAILCGSH